MRCESGAQPQKCYYKYFFALYSASSTFVGLENLLVGMYQCVDSRYNAMLKDQVIACNMWKWVNNLIMANQRTYPWKAGQVQQCDTAYTTHWADSYFYAWKNGEINIATAAASP